MQTSENNSIARPPVVTVMGHIDHGKSTLLDYIRKSKVAESEAGGITQRLSAYEVTHTDTSGNSRIITFLDTPGHEAFQHLRSRGSNVADLAILVVAADDGVKPQTLEAYRAIQEANIPYLVAISKIDKSNADVERAKLSLVENEIYLEGMGGTVPYVPIDSKTGRGIPELLDLLLLSADLEELTGDPTLPATGLVIESHCDPKRGISAVLVIKNGALKTGQYVVAGNAYAPLRIVENFLGKKIKEASFSSPISVVGFSGIPPVGEPFEVVSDKKTAVEKVKLSENNITNEVARPNTHSATEQFVLPIIIKSDVVGTVDAIKHELNKHNDERTLISVIHEGVGSITEGDVKYGSGDRNVIIVGFNVGVDKPAQELAERTGIEIVTFSIIYNLTDWIKGALEARRPKVSCEKEIGRAKILKSFSFTKKSQTIGCRVEKGALSVKDKIVYIRGEEELGRGKIVSMKSGVSDVSSVNEGNDCGLQMEIPLETEPRYGDLLTAYIVTEE